MAARVLSLSFCADKRANYDARRSTEVPRESATRSLGPEGDGGPPITRTVGEKRRGGARSGGGGGLAEEEIRAKRNRNVASKRSRQSGARLLNFDQVETADARRAAQK